jgi:hypothetical protein
MGRKNGQSIALGPWRWNSFDFALEKRLREYADRAPADGIDIDKLRDALSRMDDDRTRERFMEMVIEEIDKLPPPKRSKSDWALFHKIGSAHRWLMDAIRRDPDPIIREIYGSERAVMPHPDNRNWKSSSSDEIKQYAAKIVRGYQEIAPHVPMSKATRELASELKSQRRSAIIIDDRDDDDPKERAREERLRRHVVRNRQNLG